MPPLEQCGECVEMAAIAYAVFGAFLDAYHESLRAEFPLSVAFFPAMTEDCSLQVRTGAGPPRRRRRPKRRCKGLSDMSMPMPKNVPRRAGAKIQIQREPTSCVRLIWRCFFGPQKGGVDSPQTLSDTRTPELKRA